MKQSIIITLAVLQISLASCQTGRKIEIDFKGINDSVLYLVHYYGNSNSIADTAIRDKSGKYTFSGKKMLPEGMYVLVDESKSKSYLEFIIDNHQNFKIKTDTSDIYGNLVFTASPGNTAFRQYSLFIMKKRKEAERIKNEIEMLKNDSISSPPPGAIEKLEEELKLVDNEVKKYQRELVTNDPNSMMSVLLKMQWDPEHPYDLKNGTREDTLKAYYYTKSHFWDNIDLSDERIVRTPVFHDKLKTFMTILVVQHPDSVIYEGEKIIAQTLPAPELYKFVVWYMVNMTERSNIMGMEKAFVHFAKNYYLSGKTWWASEPVLKKMDERIRVLERILIGERAPELQMWDTNKVVTSLHQVSSDYLVLLFWDYECGHCKKILPGIRDYYNQMKDKGVKVFAVCTKTDLDKWKEYIRTNNLNWINVNGGYSINRYDTLYDIMSTPIIYLLDKDKKILAKKIELEQLKEIISIEMERARNQEGILKRD